MPLASSSCPENPLPATGPLLDSPALALLDARPVSCIAERLDPIAAQRSDTLLTAQTLALSAPCAGGEPDPQRDCYPVIDANGALCGLIDDRILLGATRAALPTPVEGLSAHACVGEARARFLQDAALRWIPLMMADGGYSGYCASRQALRELCLRAAPKPPRLGGMATPLGVYITSGRYRGGAPAWAIALNGAALAVGSTLAQIAFMIAFAAAMTWFPALGKLGFLARIWLETAFLIPALFIMLRLTPLAGLHAAEHMTINAVERRLPLTLEAVRGQSREHRRCGTNLTVLLSGALLGWLTLEAMGPYVNEAGRVLFLLGWIVLLMRYWRTAGLWLQRYFTTRAPSDAQIQSGIRAAQAVLRQYESQPHGPTPLWRRLWGSGLPQALAGFYAAQSLIDWLMGG
ncbi:MAG: DUF1385 domain-containing protein [Vampirovibrionales bacterium]|nr:DUF1385 domain-containing protein [Vampirovibrionales bacterium]